MDAFGPEMFEYALSGLNSAAGNEADAVLPCTERCRVKGLQQLRIGRDVGRILGHELGVVNDGISIGGVELGPRLPGFQFADSGTLAAGKLLRLAS